MYKRTLTTSAGSQVMPFVVCQTREGLRTSEVTAIVEDFEGTKQFIPVDKEFLSKIKQKWYMPIGLLRIDESSKAALVQLPIEADSGANRLWVKLANLISDEGNHLSE